MRVSISRVAKLAGVSVATVSNVISGKKFVSQELTERVQDAVKTLNYQPSRLARGLKEQKTYLVGLMVPDITNPFFAEIARGVESVALEYDYQVFLCNTDGDTVRESKTLNSFLAYTVDGIVNVAPRMSDSEVRQYFGSVPHVLVDRPFQVDHPRVRLVYVDNTLASTQVAEYLLAKGHRKFVCLSGPQEVQNVRNRLDGFLHTVSKAGIAQHHCRVEYGEFKYETGYSLMKKVLSSDFLPSAVFAGNDLMAWGALDAIKQAKLSVPKDIAIIGFDNVYFSSFLTPTLTTIEQPKFEMGQVAMQMLVELMEGGLDTEEPLDPIMLKCNLISRNSA